jgi:glycosyltransferase involved in cell wall biosynthesis
MNVGLVIYGSLATISGGYLFDRMLVDKLRKQGDSVEIVSIPRRSYALNLADNLRDWRPSGLDLILQDELNHPSLFLANRRTHRVPIVSIVHHLRSSERRSAPENSIYRQIERLYLNTVNGFVFNSHQTRKSVECLTSQVMPSVVATPGGDRLGTTSSAHVEARAAQPGPLHLIFVGNLIPAKGFDLLLDALGELPREDFHLDAIGSDKAAPEFAARMRRMAQERRLPVTFCGVLRESALAAMMRDAHVLVLPSFYEGFGIAYLEGMAHGLPALGTRAGAAPDLVTSGENGYLIEPGDAHALASHLAALARDRVLLARLGEAALRRYNDFPTWDQTTDRIREFLSAVAAEHASDLPAKRG